MSKEPHKEKSVRQWSVREKYDVILETEKLSEEELGGYLRKKGLHSSELEQWRNDIFSALGDAQKHGNQKGKKEQAQEIKVLKRELRRKDKALAEASALLILKKKAQLIWGDGDDESD